MSDVYVTVAHPATVEFEEKRSLFIGHAIPCTDEETALQFVKEKKTLFIGGAAALVLIIVLIIIISSCASNSPEGALNKLFNKAKNLDIKGAASDRSNVSSDHASAISSVCPFFTSVHIL